MCAVPSKKFVQNSRGYPMKGMLVVGSDNQAILVVKVSAVWLPMYSTAISNKACRLFSKFGNLLSSVSPRSCLSCHYPSSRLHIWMQSLTNE